MQLSPLDIRKQEFERKLRGVDASEVEAFLEMVANQWEEMQDEQRRLEDQIRELENKLEHYEQVEEALQEALQTARENSQQKVENAERRAEVLIDEANAKSEEIRRDAKNQHERLQRQIERLTSRRGELIAQLRGFLNSELELLARFDDDQIEVDVESAMDDESSPAGSASPDVPELKDEMPSLSGDILDDERDETEPASSSGPPRAKPAQEQNEEAASEDQERAEPFGDEKAAEPPSPEKEPEQPTFTESPPAEPSSDEKSNQAGWIVDPVFSAGEGKDKPDLPSSGDSDEEARKTSFTNPLEDEPPQEQKDEQEAQDDESGQTPPDDLEKIRRILNDLE